MVKLVEWKEGGYSPKNDPPTGEVYFGGPGVTQGYFKMPEKTAEDFITDEKGRRWFKTGDIGQFDPDGALRIIGKGLIDGKLKIYFFKISFENENNVVI